MLNLTNNCINMIIQIYYIFLLADFLNIIKYGLK